VSWPEDVRDSDWGRPATRNSTWAFDRIYQYLEYKGEERGVEVLKENEWDTSKTCSRCGDDTTSNRVERGLYVCSSCELVANADCNGAENMRQKITRVLTERIGVTAVWHSHRYTCSTARAGRFARENRLYRKPANIPPAVREAPAFTPGRMSRWCLCADRKHDLKVWRHECDQSQHRAP